MNYNETIEKLEYIYQNGFNNDFDIPGVELFLDAIREGIETLDKADRYCWHDLIKDPDDLPEPMSTNIIILADWNNHCKEEYGLVDVTLDGQWCIGYEILDNIKVYAWKYMEPFKDIK